MLEDIDTEVLNINNYEEILQQFAEWEEIGVWNISDLLTLLLTSRLHMLFADSLFKIDKDEEKEKVKDALKYLLYFINYLLSTNIHPPNKDHGDMNPYYNTTAPHPK